ncbi:MAG: HAD family hydrolase [Pseudomonadota bacterium]
MNKRKMALALFDLDNTLIAGDSDHQWGRFLCDRGLVDALDFQKQNDRFYEDYVSGKLDIQKYLRFVLAPLKGRSIADLQPLLAEFIETSMRPLFLPAAKHLLNEHRSSGDEIVIVTATNELVAKPVGRWLGVPNVLGCPVEIESGKLTGNFTGTLTYQAGKVARVQEWIEQNGLGENALADAYFYSDSLNDLPLLERVGHPVAVDPDQTLRAVAFRNGWSVISLRSPDTRRGGGFG